MKTTLQLLVLLTCMISYGQDFEFFDYKYKLDWSQFENDKITTDLLESNYENLKNDPYPELENILKDMDKYHLIDINNDMTNELIYNGWNGGEGEMIIVYQMLNNNYEKVQKFFGRIVDIRKTHDKKIRLIVYDYSCCGGYVDNLVTFDFNTEKSQFEIVNSIAKIDLTIVPKEFITPIRFEIQSTPYNLRYTPEIADGPKDRMYDFNSIQGQNITATYKAGDTGTAYAESIDITGRIWWFVVMDSKPDSGETLYYEGNNHFENYKPIGWISSRYLAIIE